MLHGGTVGSGLIGLVAGGTLKLSDILVTDSAEQRYLMSQLIYEAYNYRGDSCVSAIGDGLSSSVNMRQYLDSFQAATRTSFKYAIRASSKSGGIIGQISGADVTAFRITARLDVSASVDLAEVGLLFGAVSGTLVLSQTYVTGKISSSIKLAKAGAIGSLSGSGSVSMMAVMTIEGDNTLGAIGYAADATYPLNVYFDSSIKCVDITGGLIGLRASSASLSFSNIVGRVVFISSAGNNIGLIVGNPPTNSSSGAVINAC